MADATAAGSDASAYWRWDMSNGWMYLLPPLATRRVLCLSARPERAASQAHLFGQLVLVRDPSLPGLPQHAFPPDTRQANPQWRDVDEIAQGDDAPFDGLIIHDPEGHLVHAATLARIERILALLRPKLRPGAFVYVGLRHRWSLQQVVGRLLRRPSATAHALCAIGQVRRSLQAVGVDTPRLLPYLLWGSQLAEIIAPQGYRATKNREVLRERIKERVFGAWGAKRFTPACGLLGNIGPREKSTLDEVMEKVERTGLVAGHAGAVLKQYLVFPGDKAIVSFGPAGRDDADVVAVMAGHALAVARRRAEAATLATLATLPAPLSRLVPHVLDQSTVGNTSVFVINRFPGVSLDLDVPALEPVTDHALGFIIDLHRETARPAQVDEGVYRARVGSLVDAAVARNPLLEPELRALEGPLRAQLLGSTLPMVWQHGDFKVENVLFDPRSLALTGVIDWELAILPGLPALDPLYLLVYNRMIRGADWIQVLFDVLVRAEYTPAERERLQRYLQALGMTTAQLPALSAAFLAHHIGHRMHLLAPEPFLERLRELFREMRTVLENAPVQAPLATV